MYIYTLEKDGAEMLAAAFLPHGALYDLKALGVPYGTMNELIDHMSLSDLRALAPREDAAIEPGSYRLLAPIPRPKQDVLCLGINYLDHAAESARFSDAFAGERPAPIYFSKRVSEAAAPGETIPSYPGLVDSLDYEVELAVILGKTIKDCPAEQVKDAIFGYTILNDVSARNLQTRHTQWYRGKSLDKFTPMGPCIVTADAIPWPVSLLIRSYVNGELRQSSNTANFITSIDQALSIFSQGTTLLAGTILATGTPAGVGLGFDPPKFLKPGDVVTCEIEGIGRLENPIGQ